MAVVQRAVLCCARVIARPSRSRQAVQIAIQGLWSWVFMYPTWALVEGIRASQAETLRTLREAEKLREPDNPCIQFFFYAFIMNDDLICRSVI